MSEEDGWIIDNSSKLKSFSKYSLVFLVIFIFFFINIIPLQIANFGEVRPPFLLMAIFYWTIFRPSLVPPVFIFTLGLLTDLLLSIPFGLTALVFVSVQWLVSIQRTFLLSQGFLLVWWGFTIVIFSSSFISWGLFCLLKLSIIPIKPIFISSLLGTILFPIATVPLYFINKIIARKYKIT